MDITERLNNWAQYATTGQKLVIIDAKEKIEELNERVETLRQVVRDQTAHGVEQMKEIERLREALKKIDLATSIYAQKNIPEVVSNIARAALKESE